MTDIEDNSKQLRAAIYARVSTEEQREGHKIDSQIVELERFISDKGWVNGGTYKDDGWSGAVIARPELDKLRDDAAKGIFDAVVINDIDRLARDVSHLGIIKRDFEAKRIQLIFKKLPGKSSPTYNLLVNILGSFAEFERELIVDRTRRGRRHKAEVRNQFVGCVAPYGYHYETGSGTDGNEPIVRIVHAEARIVKQVYEWASTGISMNKIARRLEEMGIPTRKGKQRWSSTIIMIILRSEVYTGIWSYCKKEAVEPKKRRNHDPYPKHIKTSRHRKPQSEWLRVTLPAELRIIDPAFWSKVQDRIDRNPKFSPRNAKHFYLLQGLLRCAYCNAACSGTFQVRNNGRERFYYRCWKRCKQSLSTRTYVLDSKVWFALREALSDPRRLITRIVGSQTEMFRDKARADMVKDGVAHTAEEALLFQNYQSGSLSPEQLARALEQLKSNRILLQAQKANPNNSQLIKQTIGPDLLATCQLLAKELDDEDPEMRRDILRRLAVEASITTDRVKIRARIPRDEKQTSALSELSAAGIASSYSRERKRNSSSIEFELTAALSNPIKPNKMDATGA